MKLPSLIRATLMPASLAPTRFPPVAMVCSPQRVRFRRIWERMTITTAQMISAQEKPPNHLAQAGC